MEPTSPAAKNIVICMGSSCFARGNEENLHVIEDYITEMENSGQPAPELSGKCCLGKCADGPNIVINGSCYHRMDRGTLIDVLNE